MKKSKEERDDDEGDRQRHRKRVRDSESETDRQTDRQAQRHRESDFLSDAMISKKSMQNPSITFLRIKNLSVNFIFVNYSSS